MAFSNNLSFLMEASSTHSALTTDTPSLNGTTIPGTTENQGDPFDKVVEEIQIISLWVMFCIGLPGNLIVIAWIYVNLRRRSRINTIVLGLASADLMVCFFGMLATALSVQLLLKSNFLCKVFFLCVGLSLIGSPNMVIIMAIDRHQAVIYPLKKFVSARKLVLIGWLVALFLASPQLIVWSYNSDEKINRCTTTSNKSYRLIYILYIALITFLVPLILICCAYSRISYKIWVKAQEHGGKCSSKKGKVNLKRSGNKSLSKAKVKTLKMTVVIIFFFVFCTLPYFVIEVARLFTDSKNFWHIYGICSTLAVSNSAINPYIFLAFNLTKRFWSDFMVLVGRNCPFRARNNADNSFKSVRFSSSNSRLDPSSRGVTFVSRVNQETSIVPDDDVDSL